MTLQEVRNSFIVEYKFEALRRKESYIELPNGVIALWISQAQQDLADRLSLLITKQDISLTAVTTYTTYTLNSNYGEIVRAEIDGELLDVVSINDLNTTVDPLPTGTPNKIAVYNDGSGSFLAVVDPLPSQAYTLRVWYKVNTNFYSPSGDTTDWGSFTGGTWTGDLMIANKYIQGIIYYMLAKIYPDHIARYEKFVLGQRSMQGNSVGKSKYKFAGL